MTEEDYKVLMEFHILTGHNINSKLKYFAVDQNGALYGYRMKPPLDQYNATVQWIPKGEESGQEDASDISLEHQRIVMLPSPKDFRKTLIRI